VFFSPLCFSSEVLAGISRPREFRKRKSTDVNRKSFKVSPRERERERERERSGFVASQYLLEFLRTEEWKKRPKHRERERGSATSFVLGVG
jgi:hypothetical protein